jgi:hypothetical protein
VCGVVSKAAESCQEINLRSYIPDMVARAEICTTFARLATEDPAACDDGERRGGGVAAALALVGASGALVTKAAARAITQMEIRFKAIGGLETSSKIVMGMRTDFGGGTVARLWVSVMKSISTRKRTSTPPTTAKELRHRDDDVLLSKGSGEGLLRLKRAFSVDGMS